MQQLSIRGVTKRFGPVTALAGLDLEVEAGESMVILGPSGSGKSTLLRLIAGLEVPDEGEILFDGQDQRDVPAHRRGVAMVFQNFALYPHLSARANIALGLRHGLKLPREAAEQRALEVARTLGIEDLLDRRPGEMSGGQRQRVALGRALAKQAGLVLLDEPWSGLDAQLKQGLRVEIRTLLRTLGATAIFVTHDQMDALAIGDRIAVMKEGRIVQADTPEAIYEQPATTFVARFLGSPPMNLLPAEVAGGRLRTLGGAELPADGLPDGAIWVGARPERLRPEAGGALELHGEVLAAELSAGTWVLHVRVEGQTVAVRAELPRRPEPGQPITISAQARHLRYFRRADGARIEPGP